MKAKLLLYLCCIAFAFGCTKDDTIMLLAIREQTNSSVKLLQDCIDDSSRLAVVKSKLRSALQENPDFETTMGLTDESITNLFKYYAD